MLALIEPVFIADNSFYQATLVASLNWLFFHVLCSQQILIARRSSLTSKMSPLVSWVVECGPSTEFFCLEYCYKVTRLETLLASYTISQGKKRVHITLLFNFCLPKNSVTLTFNNKIVRNILQLMW
jgi:hypothetical protein